MPQTSGFKIEPVERVYSDASNILKIRHNYHEHPLFQLGSLQALAERLNPLEKCRFMPPETKTNSPFNHNASPTDGGSISEVFESIHKRGSWIALYDVQLDSTYCKLLNGVRSQIEGIVKVDQAVHDVRAFIFISSPPSITPYHIDRENNFWLQIRGHKKLTLWNNSNCETTPAEDVENFLLFGNLSNISLTNEIESQGHIFNCSSGDGVYFPMTTPHMTESHPDWMEGESVTISVGMVFYSDVTRRKTRVNMMNYFMRSIGMSPSLPGKSVPKDKFKALVGRGLWEVRKQLRSVRGKTPSGRD